MKTPYITRPGKTLRGVSPWRINGADQTIDDVVEVLINRIDKLEGQLQRNAKTWNEAQDKKRLRTYVCEETGLCGYSVEVPRIKVKTYNKRVHVDYLAKLAVGIDDYTIHDMPLTEPESLNEWCEQAAKAIEQYIEAGIQSRSPRESAASDPTLTHRWNMHRNKVSHWQNIADDYREYGYLMLKLQENT